MNVRQLLELYGAREGAPVSAFADRFRACRAGRLPAQLLGSGPVSPSFVRCSSVRFWRLLPSDPQDAGSVPLSSWLKDSASF